MIVYTKYGGFHIPYDVDSEKHNRYSYKLGKKRFPICTSIDLSTLNNYVPKGICTMHVASARFGLLIAQYGLFKSCSRVTIAHVF